MRKKPESVEQLDLFTWSEPVRPMADVIDFLDRRERLPRWVLNRGAFELRRLELRFERSCGDPPAPILPLRRA